MACFMKLFVKDCSTWMNYSFKYDYTLFTLVTLKDTVSRTSDCSFPPNKGN